MSHLLYKGIRTACVKSTMDGERAAIVHKSSGAFQLTDCKINGTPWSCAVHNLYNCIW